jgi:hypothetical protein
MEETQKYKRKNMDRRKKEIEGGWNKQRRKLDEKQIRKGEKEINDRRKDISKGKV